MLSSRPEVEAEAPEAARSFTTSRERDTKGPCPCRPARAVLRSLHTMQLCHSALPTLHTLAMGCWKVGLDPCTLCRYGSCAFWASRP